MPVTGGQCVAGIYVSIGRWVRRGVAMTSTTAARTAASVLANHVISESLSEAKAKFRDVKPQEL
jgi:hypothetical protein